MKICAVTFYAVAFALILGSFISAKPAHAQQTLGATYYTISATDKDANNLCCGLYNNEVQNTLGPNGLPVLNTAAYGCTSNCFTGALPADVLPDGEITYWSPTLNNGGAGGTSDVTQSLTGATVTLPYNNNSFFAPNGAGSCDGPSPCDGYQAALFSGVLDAPSSESVGFLIGSDDMAFVYLDGQIACDDGGVHANGSVPCTTFTVPAGNNSIEVFYVDINQSNAALDLSITSVGITTTPPPQNPPPTGVTPEPSSLVLLGTGLAGLAVALRRRLMR